MSHNQKMSSPVVAFVIFAICVASAVAMSALTTAGDNQHRISTRSLPPNWQGLVSGSKPHYIGKKDRLSPASILGAYGQQRNRPQYLGKRGWFWQWPDPSPVTETARSVEDMATAGDSAEMAKLQEDEAQPAMMPFYRPSNPTSRLGAFRLPPVYYPFHPLVCPVLVISFTKMLHTCLTISNKYMYTYVQE